MRVGKNEFMITHPQDRSLKMGMLICAIAFAVMAVIAGAFGATAHAVTTVAVAKLLCFICVVLCTVLLTFRIVIGKR